MSTVTCISTVPLDRVAAFLVPRNDLLAEVADGENRFVLADGPFNSWERIIDVEPVEGAVAHPTDGVGGVRTDKSAIVTEVVSFRIAAPFWGWLFVWPLRRRIAKRHRRIAQGQPTRDDEKQPVWLPPQRLDARSASVLSTLVTLALAVGYLGTLITQTITFAATQFGASTGDQSEVLAVTRIGVLISLAVVVAADRRGRRTLLLASVALACITAAFGALATGMVSLGVTQTISRAFSTSALVLLAVMAAEEMPAGSRAYAVSVMTLTAGLGAGMCVWFLPLADFGLGGWRWLYVVPLAGLPLTWWSAHHLPETRRFTRPHHRARIRGHGRRLLLLGGALFATALFAAPASQLQNNFLKHQQGFSAAHIALFTLVTSTPGGVGIVIGGHLADTRGRRVIGAIGVVGGAGFTLLAYFSHGWSLWMWSFVGTIIAGMAVPALAVYGPELFPTALRGKANGILQAAAVAGSSLGLLVVGGLVDRWGQMGPAMAVVVAGPLIVGVLLLVAYPETAHRELEDLNPEDRAAPSTILEA